MLGLLVKDNQIICPYNSGMWVVQEWFCFAYCFLSSYDYVLLYSFIVLPPHIGTESE